MRAVRIAAGIAAGIIAGTMAARADDTPPPDPAACPAAAGIVALADLLLVERQDAPKFWRDVHGTDAAFLRIAYGGLRDDDPSAFLDDLAARAKPPLRIDELRLAAMSVADRAAALDAMKAAAPDRPLLAGLGQSVLRALVVDDGGDRLFEELAAWRAADSAGLDASPVLASLALSVADLDDAALAALAARAEDGGHHRLAVLLLSYQRSLAGLAALADRLPAGSFGAGPGTIASDRDGLFRMALSIADLRADFDLASQPAAVRAVGAARSMPEILAPVVALATVTPEAELLLEPLSQTGEATIATDLAAGLAREIEAGTILPPDLADLVVTRIVAGLDDRLGRSMRMQILAGTRVPASVAPDNEPAADFAERALVRAALVPWFAGRSETLPERPEAVSDGAAFETGLAVARHLKAGGSFAPADAVIAGELIGAAGQPVEAAEAFATAPDRVAALRAADLLMRRLDRGCSHRLGHPLPFNPPLYRF